MLFLPFTCRANPSNYAISGAFKPFIPEHLTEKSPQSAALDCKLDSDRRKKGGLGTGPPRERSGL